MNDTFDVIVLGGGWGGVSAAIAASRAGADTLLVERGICLGGVATNAGIGEINGSFTEDGRCVIPQSMRTILARGIARGSMVNNGYRRFSADPDFGCTRVRFDSEDLKCLLDEAVLDANVKLLLQTTPREILPTERGYTVVTDTLGGALTLSCRVLIDATGNSAAVAAIDPACVIETDAAHRQGATLIFRMANIDHARWKREVTPEVLAAAIDEGVACGALPQRILSVCLLPGTNEAACNLTRMPGAAENDPEALTAGVLELRRQAKRAAAFLIKRMPGMENAYLSRFADAVGIRERRRIDGVRTLTGEALVTAAPDHTAVAFGCYPVDIHREGGGKAVQFQHIGGNGIYSIPYGCLVPKRLHNVLASGRIISCNDTAYGAVRIMSPVMSIGNAAGRAAAMAARMGVPAARIDVAALRRELAADYPDLGDYFTD